MLELPSGDIITESLTIMEYLDKISDQNRLYLDKPVEFARQKMVMSEIDVVQSLLFGILMTHGNNEKMVT